MKKSLIILLASSTFLFAANTPEGIKIQTVDIDNQKIVFDKLPDERGMFSKPFFKNIGPFMNRGFDKVPENSKILLVNAGLPVLKALFNSRDTIKDVASESGMDYDIDPSKADVIIDIELYAVTNKEGKFLRTNLAESMKANSGYSSEMGAANSLKNAGYTNTGNTVAAVAGIDFVMNLFGDRQKWIYKFVVKPKNAEPYTVMVYCQSQNAQKSAQLMGKVLKNDLLKDN